MVPAWLLSALLHFVLVLVLSLLFTTATELQHSEPVRDVSLVLSRVANDQVEFFADQATAAESGAAASAQDNSDALPSPDAAAALLPSDISLPTQRSAIVGDSSLVESPQYTVTGNRGLPSSIDPAAIEAERTALRKARAARGSSTRLSVFGGRAAEGRSFVFLIDRSRSMGNQGLGALEAAERELLRALEPLRSTHQFQVIAYHHKCVFLTARKLLRATEENKAALAGHVSGLAAFGATEHEMALMSGLYLEPDVIFLLTDGGDPELDDAQLGRIYKLARGRTTIHCVQFGFGPLREPDNFLYRLAAQNGGGYGYVDMTAK